jgi:hypothetical protein
MPAMSSPENPPQRHLPVWALGLSLAIHVGVLLLPHHEPAGSGALPALQARLTPRAPQIQPHAPPAEPDEAAPSRRSKAKPQPRPRLLMAEKSRGPTVASSPKWTAAEKADMDGFLDGLEAEAKAAPKPTLAQRSLAMARDYGRQMARQDEAGEATLEARPNGPPADPFSLELYLDGLVRRLNRSAGFVRNDPRSKGVKKASIQFRLNPDGSLKSFAVLNAGDQAEEIAFIKSVVEKAVPFLPFPPDIDKAARSLGVIICIQPGRGDGGFGFTRTSGRGC